MPDHTVITEYSTNKNNLIDSNMKVTNETRKIMHFRDDMPISCTAVRVPVFVGHSEAIDLEFEKDSINYTMNIKEASNFKIIIE